MNSNLYYKQKYLKYKSKYTKLKKLYGGNRVPELICNGFADANKQADSKYIINLDDKQFNNMIKLKKNFNYDNYYSYISALNFKDDTVGDNMDGTDSTGKFEKMIKLKYEGFTDKYSFLAVKELNQIQIDKMIIMKQKGFAENFAYAYITNSGQDFKNPSGKLIKVTELKPEQEIYMLENKKTDIEAYITALNYTPPT